MATRRLSSFTVAGAVVALGVLTAVAAADARFGYRPPTVDLSDVAACWAARLAAQPQRKGATDLPVYFNSCDSNWVTSVKNQNPYGSCWAFAAMGVLEGSIRKTEGLTLDLSENNLLNRCGFDGFVTNFNCGGNGYMAAAYLLRWDGPVLEEQDPYASIGTSPALPPIRHVQDVRIILPRTGATDNDGLKRAIRDYGVVMSSYYHDDDYFNFTTAAYCCSRQDSNHAICLVGWDDNYAAANFKKPPPGNGAFLAKGSWGDWYGKKGYYYISYYDTSLGKADNFAYPKVAATNNYARVYQYDEFGLVGINGYGRDATKTSMANHFTAVTDERLQAVGFYALAPETSYTVTVYTNATVTYGSGANCELSGDKACSVAGQTAEAGFLTLSLPQAVPLAANTKFSVVIAISSPDVDYPIAVEYAVENFTSRARANAGESFVCDDPAMHSWEDISANGVNCCIKAYTQNASSDGPVDPEEPEVPEAPAEYYVDAASTAASPDGLTPDTAFRDLPEAMAVVASGDVIWVAPGTYSPVMMPLGVTDVAIVAMGTPDETVIDAEFEDCCCSAESFSFDDGLYLEGFTLYQGGGVAAVDARGNCSVYGGGALAAFLSRCVIVGCEANVGGAVYDCDLLDCLIVGNETYGYGGACAASYLFGCTVTANEGYYAAGGVDMYSSAYNSIIWDNWTLDGSSPDCEFYGKGWATYGATLYSCCTSIDPGGDSQQVLVADPKFVNPDEGDYRLRSCSPCLDTGNPEYVFTDYDLLGNARVQGMAPDMGALEGAWGPAPTRLASPKALRYDGTEQFAVFDFVCETDWTATTTVDWIVVRTPEGEGDSSDPVFLLTANTSEAPRDGVICVTDAAGVVLTQAVHQAVLALPPARESHYYGLFVGVGDYAPSLGLKALSGCVPDACNLQEAYTYLGYCRELDARLLTNALATVSAVRTALTNLAEKAVAGDVVFYYQSGHGAQIGGSASRQMALVEYDGHYYDEDVACDLGLFAKGVRVIVVADTCHSGGLFKSVSSVPSFDFARRVHDLMKTRREGQSAGVLRTRPTSGTLTRAVPDETRITPEEIGWIAAADYDESSYDSSKGGVFTLEFLDGWTNGGADYNDDGRVSFYDLYCYAQDAGAYEAEPAYAQCLNEDVLDATLAGVTSRSMSESETYNTPVRVPFAWLDPWMQTFGLQPLYPGGPYCFYDYSHVAAATTQKVTGKIVPVWQDYVAGTNPTDTNSVFRADIAVSNETVYVTWRPKLSSAEEALRTYTIYGREDMAAGTWGPTNAASRFFKVDVRMK